MVYVMVAITVLISALVGYLSYALGALAGFTKALKLEREEVDVVEEFQQSLPHQRIRSKNFHIIPSRREKAELDEEEAQMATPESWRKNHPNP